MKKLRLVLLLCIFYVTVSAQNINKETAIKVAENFLSKNSQNIKTKTSNYNFEEIEFTSSNQKQIILKYKKAFYILNSKNSKSYVIVSASKKVSPILAYSFNNNFSSKEMPPALKEWLQRYESQINKIKNSKTFVSDKIKTAWGKYDVENFVSAKGNQTKAVSNLLTTTWNQGRYYNADCPECSSGGSGGRVWAGCVATAYAQVMKHYSYPATGEGEHSYTHSVYGYQYADFGNTTYDWSSMPSSISSDNNDIAQLLYHCGVAVNMNYSPSGSGASGGSARNSMVNYFKYSSNSLYTSKGNYTEENWKKLLRREIDLGRPMYYVGRGSGGHAFNCDGYDDSEGFHFNWGWGGSYNGYFLIDDLTPGSHDYSNSQAALVGSIPRHLDEKFDSVNAIALTAGTPYNGTTVDGSNIVNSYTGFYSHVTGLEKIHKITTSFPGRISAKLTNLGDNDLDVFILKYANKDAALAYGDVNAVLDNAEAGNYYIVVDGKYAYEGTYTLTISCPNEKADLVIENPEIQPYVIVPGTGFQVNSTIKNIGNSNAVANKLEYFLSDDTELSGDDILIGFSDIQALNSKQDISVSEIINLPEGVSAGTMYVILKIDADNVVEETDEDLNTANASFQVPETGIMDCSSAIILEDNVVYNGNTATNGNANIEDYSYFMGLTNKEIIHSFTPEYSGMIELEFSESLEGEMQAILLSGCNENACISSFAIWDPEAITSTHNFHVIGGLTYYIVIDGNNDMGNSEGEYSIKLNFPKECLEPFIYDGDFDKCEGDGFVFLSTHWAFPNYQWFKNDVLIDGETNSYLRADQTGFYSVKVTENNCTVESEKVQVRYNSKPTAEISALSATTFCDNKDVTLQLSTNGAYTYQWTKNDIDITDALNLTYDAFETGTYKVKVTNISCTVESNQLELDALSSPVVNLGEDVSILTNETVTLDAGSGFVSYLWNTAEDTQSIIVDGNMGRGDYYFDVTVTNDNSCENSDTILISIEECPNPVIQQSDIDKCDGDEVTHLNTSSEFTNYQWYKNDVLIADETSFEINVNETGGYSVKVTDNDCVAESDKVQVNYNSKPTASISTLSETAFCNNKGVILELTTDADYTYQWIKDNTNIEAATGLTYNAFETGTYKVKVANENCFTESNEIEVEAFESAEVNLGEDIVINTNETVTLDAGGGFANYLWNTGKDTQSIVINGNMGAGNYSFDVTVTNDNSCEDSDTILISIEECPNPVIQQSDIDKCDGDEVTHLNTSSEFTNYQWYKNDVLIADETSFEINVNETGAYSVEVTEHNCTVISEKVHVNYNSVPTAEISSLSSPSFCNNKGVILELITDADYTYQWIKDNINIATATGLTYNAFETGTYKVKVTNENCFTESNEIEVESFVSPEVNLGDDIAINTNETVTLDAGSSFTSYLWNTGEDTQSIVINGNRGEGNYYFDVTVTNDNSCENSDTILVTVNQATSVYNETFENAVSIFPNPANEFININFENLQQKTYIEIYDIQGNLKRKREIVNSANKKINISAYSKGIYFIKLINNDNKIIRKIVIE